MQSAALMTAGLVCSRISQQQEGTMRRVVVQPDPMTSKREAVSRMAVPHRLDCGAGGPHRLDITEVPASVRLRLWRCGAGDDRSPVASAEIRNLSARRGNSRRIAHYGGVVDERLPRSPFPLLLLLDTPPGACRRLVGSLPPLVGKMPRNTGSAKYRCG